MMHGWNDGWLGFVWWLVLIAVIVAIVFAVVRITSAPPRTEPREAPHPGPLEILADRFARGEITSEDYAERRRVLEDHSPSR